MRLTKKKWHQLNNHKKDWFEYVPGKYSLTDIVYKLAELEDVEEELGIDLITLFKALLRGYVYGITKDGIKKLNIGNLTIRNLTALTYSIDENNWRWVKKLHLTDYGKTWALTRKELL